MSDAWGDGWQEGFKCGKDEGFDEGMRRAIAHITNIWYDHGTEIGNAQTIICREIDKLIEDI